MDVARLFLTVTGCGRLVLLTATFPKPIPFGVIVCAMAVFPSPASMQFIASDGIAAARLGNNIRQALETKSRAPRSSRGTGFELGERERSINKTV